ncbi:MAG TPA: DMT family transporter [Mariprofundaceae bacterium]|nr:DMT family transporter [Mariprofundaceae bacterium]
MSLSVVTIQADQRQSLTGFALAFMAATFFSIKAIFVKLAYRYGVDAVTLLALRMLFSLPFFVVIALIEERKPGKAELHRRHVAAIVGLGLVGYYLASLFDFVGLQYVSAGLERLILFLFPTFTVLLSVLFLGYRISRVEILALLLSYGGIALAVQQEVALGGAHTLFGSLMIFGSTLAFSTYLVGSGEMIPRIGARRFMAYAMLVSCLAVIVQFFFTHDIAVLRQPLPVYLYGFLMATVSTVLPSFMLAGAIHRIGASHTSIIGGIGPVMTIILAALFLGERMSPVQIAGGVLVIAGALSIGFFRSR